MKHLRHFFLVLPTQCCFYSDSETRNPREKRTNSRLDLTESTVKKSLASSSNEQESFTAMIKLLLEVKDSPSIQTGKVFHLTPAGLLHSPRQDTGGKIIIGRDTTECDIVLSRDTDIGSRHCAIEFSPKERAFCLKDLGDGNGTFIRIERKEAIHHGDVVNFGESHARVMVEDRASICVLTLQFYEGPLAQQEIAFKSTQQPISIGRTTDCMLAIDDPKLSISHCLLTYDERTLWSITDGDGIKHSANGTWYALNRLYVDHELPIPHGALIRAGNTVFKVTLTQASIIDEASIV